MPMSTDNVPGGLETTQCAPKASIRTGKIHIPDDLIPEIIEKVNDVFSLMECAQVSRTWWHVSRRILFRTVSIKKGAVGPFYKILTSPHAPSIAKAVENIDIPFGYANTEIDEVIKIVDLCVRAQVREWTDASCERIMRCWYSHRDRLFTLPLMIFRFDHYWGDSDSDSDGPGPRNMCDPYRRPPFVMSLEKDAFVNVRDISMSGFWKEFPDQVGEFLFRNLVNLQKLDFETHEVEDRLCLNTVLNNVSTSLVQCILRVKDYNRDNRVPLHFQGRQLDKVTKLFLSFRYRDPNDKFWTSLKFFPNVKWLIIGVKRALNLGDIARILELCPFIETFHEHASDRGGFRRVALPHSQQFL
ncbi:hypothetical protein HDU76_006515, partial [Blyttiomyces sp. JEL0837]